MANIFENCDQIETYLNTLPEDILSLDIRDMSIESFHTLPQSLEKLNCANNVFTPLANLPQSLEELHWPECLHTLPQNIEILHCANNTIYEIVTSNRCFQMKQKFQILNNFRHLYYCLIFKKQLRKWLWEKVREPNIKKKYHPNYLVERLGDEDDLDTVLINWK